jgi:GT2 family glycosyltransferase
MFTTTEIGNQRDSRMAAALVVLNYNGRDLLLDCLEHIERVDYQPVHTVVVDNGSDDGSAESVRRLHPRVHLVRNGRNVGVAGGRNAGIRWAEKNLDIDCIVFLDNDTQVEPDAIGEMIAAAGHPGIGLVAPKAFRKKGDRVLLSAGGMMFNPYTGVLRDMAGGELDTGQYECIREVQACAGYAFLVRREVFQRVGLFDEAFNPYGWEDVDFSLRAAKAGFRILYAPKAIVYHAGGRAGRGAVSIYERHKARNFFYFARQHTTMVQWLCFLCLLPVRVFGRVVREIAAGNSRVVLDWFSILRRSE